VEVIAAAVPSLFGCKDEAELMDKLQKGELESVKVRVNVRGVLRIEGGVVERYIGKVGPSPLITKVLDLGPCSASPLATAACTGACLESRRTMRASVVERRLCEPWICSHRFSTVAFSVH
jgi:hypothetical protein